MSASCTALISGDEQSPRLSWDQGPARPIHELRSVGVVALPSGPRTLAAAVAELHALPPADLRALGAWLYAALGPPTLLEGGSALKLAVEPLFQRSLPWHLLHDGVNWLTHRGVQIQVQARAQQPLAYLGLNLRVRAVDLRSVDSGLRAAWEDALLPYSPDAQRLLVDEIGQAAELTGRQPPLDLLHVLVEPGQPEQPGLDLSLLGGSVWGELDLRWALEVQPPRILILEAPGPPGHGLRRRAAALAELVPCVVLACPARDGVALSTGVRLVETMFAEALPPVAAARAIEAAEAREPARAISCYGGTATPRPPKEDRWARWYLDDGWRVSLDRKDQTALALGEIRAAARDRARSSKEDPGHGVVLSWHGPAHSGLNRFLRRLSWELQEEEQRPCEVVQLEWPEHVNGPDLAEQYRLRFGALPTDRPALRGAIDRLIGATEADWSVVLLHHGVLSPQLGRTRYGADVIARAVGWWATTVVPAFPRRVLPVLALPLLAEPRDDTPDALALRLGEAHGRLRPVSCRALPLLPDLRADHIVDHIQRYGLIPEDGPWSEVADEIIARTGGNYEETVHLVEQIPWTWRALSDAHSLRSEKR